MKLIEMLRTLRTAQFERIELRNDENNEILTCPAISDILMRFNDYEVMEWFPHGAPSKDATFTVLIRGNSNE